MITTTSDLPAALSDLIRSVPYDRLFVVADENTARHCVPLLADRLDASRIITIPSGDEHKTLSTLTTVWDALEAGGATRHSLLINVGGGVVTDLGGFAAATFKRGIRYINVPTTLLAMVDAAVGGKTAINYHGLKNEIGAFHQPEHIILCPRFLTTLDKENLLSGMAEMCKHHLLSGPHAAAAMERTADLFTTLLHHPDDDVYAAAAQAIADSVTVKERIVTADPTEQGLRKALNLGHTLGHAVEELLLERGTPVLHGFAVAWGLMGELYLSHLVSAFPLEALRATTRLLRELYGCPPIGCKDYDTLLSLMKHDKKNSSADTVCFALLNASGDIRIDCTASREQVFEAIDFMRDGC